MSARGTGGKYGRTGKVMPRKKSEEHTALVRRGICAVGKSQAIGLRAKKMIARCEDRYKIFYIFLIPEAKASIALHIHVVFSLSS